jgi:hypothetical protein
MRWQIVSLFSIPRLPPQYPALLLALFILLTLITPQFTTEYWFTRFLLPEGH